MRKLNLGTRPLRTLAIAACLTTAAVVISCNSFIDPKPTDILAPENFYKSGTDAVAGVNAIYEQNRWGHWLSYWYMSDIASDDIIASPNFGSDGHRMAEYTFDPSEGTLAGPWTDFYRTINRANAVLDRVPAITMDSALKTRVLGEAHYLRALAYFELVRFYGDVPLIQHEVKSLTGLDVSRAPQAQVYALIVSDLQTAVTSLPASYTGEDVGRATSGAAKTLLGKVYLQQKNYASAAQTLGEIIASGQYHLNPVWKDNFAIAQEITNPESIFEVNYDADLNPGTGSIHTLFSLPSNFQGGDAYGLMQVLPSLVNMFGPTDVRGNHGTFMISPYTDKLNRVNTWTVPNGAAFDKYLDENDAQNMKSRGWVQQNNNWIISRFADVLLMYAEAVNEGGAAGPISAAAALDSVRLRAHIGPANAVGQAALRDSIRVERSREFVFEGQRWFDLSRWGILDSALRAKQAEMGVTVRGAPSNFFPIPQSERDINPNLTQNAGW